MGGCISVSAPCHSRAFDRILQVLTTGLIGMVSAYLITFSLTGCQEVAYLQMNV